MHDHTTEYRGYLLGFWYILHKDVNSLSLVTWVFPYISMRCTRLAHHFAPIRDHLEACVFTV